MQAHNDSASAIVRTGSGVLLGYVLAGGSDASTLTLDDSTDGSGAVLGAVAAVTGGSAVVTGLRVSFTDGLYATLTGTAAQFTVYID